jgi:hypothetical protein
VLLSAVAVAFAQSDVAPPIPTWNGEGSLPRGSGDRKVFLTPDQHSVIILWPNSNGTQSRRRFDLHNSIDPRVSVRVERSHGGFLYTYELENGKRSKDSLTDFFVVIYPDPQIQANSTLWKGGLSLRTVKERVGIPGAPPGSLVDWTCCLSEQPLLPGSRGIFTLATFARPGFTSASTEHFPHLDLTDQWPEEILNQLGPVLEPKWVAKHIITLGPRYGPDEPASKIASDYMVGIQELIRIQRLERDSPFVKEAIANLDSIIAGSSTLIPFSRKPQSELEAEILAGLELSLHISYHGPQ